MHLGVQGDNRPNFRVLTEKDLTYLTGGTALQLNQWYYVYGIYNGITSKIYINNVEIGSYTINGLIKSPAAPLLIGRRAMGDNRFFVGIMDEVRVSYKARSVEWFKTEFNNQNSPSTFYILGEEEQYSRDWTFWNNASNPDTSYPWEWYFDSPDGEGYYQFYTKGTYSGTEEEEPTVADETISYKDESSMSMMT